MAEKPNCFKCKHRRELINDYHSACVHPSFSGLENIFNIISPWFYSKRTQCGPIQFGEIFVEGNKRGIEKGWFNHPFNFDPLWLKNCDGFEKNKDL